MPKDEFDFEDPMELSGVALFTEEDTTDAMCECFIEEFMRLGWRPERILALFRNPHYVGMNMVLQNRGGLFVRDRIAEVFERWGRPVGSWTGFQLVSDSAETHQPAAADQGDRLEARPTLTDPMGAPAPEVTI